MNVIDLYEDAIRDCKNDYSAFRIVNKRVRVYLKKKNAKSEQDRVKKPIVLDLQMKVRRFISHPEIDGGIYNFLKRKYGLVMWSPCTSSYYNSVPHEDDLLKRTQDHYRVDFIEENMKVV